jgi:hypothetical protein
MVTNTGKTPKSLMAGGKCKPTKGAKKCVHTKSGGGKFVGSAKGGKSSGKGGK